MEHNQTVEIRPGHRIEVGEAAKYLLRALNCDDWFVACERDHLLVIQLSRQGTHQFAVRFECTSSVDKAIYHGSKAWLLSIIPLHSENDLSGNKMEEIRDGLAQLG